MTNKQIVLFCGLLTGASAFSIDIMLPAFAVMAEDLGADYLRVQMAIPFFLIAMGVSQLFMGSASDRFGRKPVLIAGLALYTCGSLICVSGPTIEWILAGRVVQGIGISAAPVVARAVLRDISSGKELARNMALASMIFAICPIIAPLIGVGLMQFADWRILFVILLVFGIGLLLTTVFLFPETAKHKSATATHLPVIFTNIVTLFRHPVSRYNLILSGIIMSIVVLILTNLPAVFDANYGVSGAAFAFLFALHGFGIIFGQIVNRHYLNALGILTMIRFGAIGQVVVLGALLLLVWSGLDNQYWFSFMMFLLAVFYLVVFTNTASLVLEHHPKIAGFGSAFYGFISQVASGLIGMSIVYLVGSDALLFSTALFVIALSVLVAFLLQKPAE